MEPTPGESQIVIHFLGVCVCGWEGKGIAQECVAYCRGCLTCCSFMFGMGSKTVDLKSWFSRTAEVLQHDVSTHNLDNMVLSFQIHSHACFVLYLEADCPSCQRHASADQKVQWWFCRQSILRFFTSCSTCVAEWDAVCLPAHTAMVKAHVCRLHGSKFHVGIFSYRTTPNSSASLRRLSTRPLVWSHDAGTSQSPDGRRWRGPLWYRE